MSYIIELHVVTRARTTTGLTRTVPNYRRAVECERAPHTAQPVMERDDLFVEGAPCREIRDPCPSRGYSLPPRGTRRKSPFLDRGPTRNGEATRVRTFFWRRTNSPFAT